jgi:hypothetical protein
MTKDEALKLALEGAANYIDALGGDSRKYRQALANDALDKKAENARELGLDYEPVGWWDAKIGFFEEKHFDQLQPLYTTPPAAQRQWVGLNLDDMPDIRAGDHAFLSGALWAETKLKELNA